MKKCTKCNQTKDINQFPIRKIRGNQKRIAQCKSCFNEYYRTYMKNNLTHQKRVALGKRRRVDDIAEIKLSKGCQLCGYKKSSRALHFHHKDPKDKIFEIGRAASRQISLSIIKMEMQKCILLCANCHCEVEEGLTKLP